MMLYKKIDGLISQFDFESIDEVRRESLYLLIEFIQSKVDKKEVVKLNFICTHNSRRSHLAQVWAQTAAITLIFQMCFVILVEQKQLLCFPAVIDTLKDSGFDIKLLSDSKNSNYAIKYAENKQPIIGFSKRWDDSSNPKDSFCTVMTCSEADADCPIVFGTEQRIPIHYNDPKKSVIHHKKWKGTVLQTWKSLQK